MTAHRGGGPFGRTAVAIASAAILLGACSDDGQPNESVPISPADETEVLPADSTPAVVSVPEDVTPSGVVLAATLIASGNVDDAVASGLVTPAEVDEARQAIEEGSLDRWVQLAQAD